MYYYSVLQRIAIVEPKIVTIEWVERKEAFEFRLIQGGRFLTPRLLITPLLWYDLLQSRFVELKKDGETWISLTHARPNIEIRPNYERVADVNWRNAPIVWGTVNLMDLYQRARVDRGLAPEAGWERIHNEQLEAIRDSWNS